MRSQKVKYHVLKSQSKFKVNANPGSKPDYDKKKNFYHTGSFGWYRERLTGLIRSGECAVLSGVLCKEKTPEVQAQRNSTR
ncbi:hypothetical protein ACROYT_G009513 [Oculina patagonica]